MYTKTHEIGETLSLKLGEHNSFLVELVRDEPVDETFKRFMTGRFVTVQISLVSDLQGAIYSDFVKNGYVKVNGDLRLVSEKGIMSIGPNEKKTLFSCSLHITTQELIEVEFVMKPEVTLQGVFIPKTVLQGHLIV